MCHCDLFLHSINFFFFFFFLVKSQRSYLNALWKPCSAWSWKLLLTSLPLLQCGSIAWPLAWHCLWLCQLCHLSASSLMQRLLVGLFRGAQLYSHQSIKSCSVLLFVFFYRAQIEDNQSGTRMLTTVCTCKICLAGIQLGYPVGKDM